MNQLRMVAELSRNVSHQMRNVVFENKPVAEASEDLEYESLNELNIEEDIELALLDIASLDSKEPLEEIDLSDLDKLHEKYLSHERTRLGLVNTIHAGVTPMKSFINISSPEQEGANCRVNVDLVSNTPMDETDKSKLPSGLTIDMGCLKC